MEEKRRISFVFDIDGVLLDVRSSYYQTVITVLKLLLGVDLSVEDVLKFKKIKGFNDDWDVAVALFSFYRYKCVEDMELYLSLLDGRGIEGVFELCRMSEGDVARVVKLCKEVYGGIDRCEYLFGFRPDVWKKEGFYRNETPLITLSELPEGIEVGIVTGRNSKEAELAMDILGWKNKILPERVITTDSGVKKPNPKALELLFSRMKFDCAVYFGDGMDDCFLVKNYKKLHPEVRLYFCGIYDSDGKKESFLREGADIVSPSLKGALSIVAHASKFCNIS